MYYTENNRKDMCKKMEYGKAYVLPQKYENLISIKLVFESGTIFKDLICPYCEKKSV